MRKMLIDNSLRYKRPLSDFFTILKGHSRDAAVNKHNDFLAQRR
jgi:hypothetical protein